MISTLTIQQDNKVSGSDLMPVHSPLIFLIDAEYTGAAPDFVYCKVRNENDQLLGTFKCIPYADVNTTKRRFYFIADSILQGYMNSFDDFAQNVNSFIYVPDITKVFKLEFSDPDENASDVQTTITACHGVRQFGDNPNMHEIFNNENETILACKGFPTYVYFYNDNESNVITIDNYTATFIISDLAGFVDSAKVTVAGIEIYTDSGGEAVFSLNPGDYYYTIEKTGYITKSGNFSMGSGNIELNITIVAQTLEAIVFELDKKGYDGVRYVSASKGGALIAGGHTTFLGNTVTLNLYVPDTYEIYGESNRCSGFLAYEESLALTDTSSPVSLVPTKEPFVLDITFNVIDPINDLEGVEITADGSTPFDSPCNASILTTDALGIATVSIYGLSEGKPISGDYKFGRTWHAAKAGYSTASGSGITINESDYNPGTGHYEKLVTIKLNPL